MRRMLFALIAIAVIPSATFSQSSRFPNAGAAGGGAATNPTAAASQALGGAGQQTGTGTTGTGTDGSTIGQGATTGVGQTSGQTVLDSTAIGNNTFTGRTTNQGFVGNTQVGQQQANLNAFNQMFQGMQRAGGQGNRGAGQTNTERFQMRPTLRVGFEYAPTTATASVTSPKFVSRFNGITARRPQLAGVNISSDYEGRVVLRGSVANEDSKSLAAALLRLEPGVREVVNELTVAAPAAQ